MTGSSGGFQKGDKAQRGKRWWSIRYNNLLCEGGVKIQFPLKQIYSSRLVEGAIQKGFGSYLLNVFINFFFFF